MDFIVKYYGVVISIFVGNGNVYLYKYNGVEYYILSI